MRAPRSRQRIINSAAWYLWNTAFSIVLKNRINVLEEQIRELKREKEQMEKENVRLRKALNKKDLNVLKTL